MSTGIQLGDILRGGYNVAKTSLGHRIIGHLSQPVFANLREIELEKLREEEIGETEENKTEPKPFLESAIDFFKLRFTFGDLITLAGVALMTVQSFFSPAREGREPGFFEKFFKTVGLAMTFGGSTSAIVGRAAELDLKTALGKDYVMAQLSHAQSKGMQIFKKFDAHDKAELKREAEKLDRILVYKHGVRESILERYARDEIGGLLDGPPGTGKTAGVDCLLGKWAKRIENEGQEAVIAKLNLANFDEYLKDRKRAREEFSEALQAGAGVGLGGSFAANEGIQVLEMLIRQIQKLKTDVDRHNMKSGVKKQKLAVFVDEFDKVFDPATLEGCDKSRLKNLLIQFNELFMKTDILLTSNKTLEEMIAILKDQLYVDEQQTGSEVWEPLYDRFVSKNRVLVDLPSSREQAEIIAGTLLDEYSYAIDWKDFGLQGPTGTFELDRKLLADAIEHDVTSKITRKMNGRQLKYTCDDISGMLLGLARVLRLRHNPIPDKEWNRLSTQDRILRAGAKINRQVLSSVINHKISNMKLDITEKQNYQPAKSNSLIDLIAKGVDQFGKALGKSDLKIDPNLVGALMNGLLSGTGGDGA